MTSWWWLHLSLICTHLGATSYSFHVSGVVYWGFIFLMKSLYYYVKRLRMIMEISHYTQYAKVCKRVFKTNVQFYR